jgi:unsaturated chondroitin disaccharide hydrolase
MKKIFCSVSCLLILFVIGCSSSKKLNDIAPNISVKWIDQNLQFAAGQYKVLVHQVPEGGMPGTFTNDKLVTCKPGNWIAGFYPGNLIFLFEATGDSSFYNEALHKISLMEPEQYNTGTHDLGFMMYCSYGNLYKISPEEKYKQILLNSARSLSTRFNPEVGCIRSWGNSNDTSEFKVIIDNMMNLELLMWAAKETGDSSFYHIAISHANTTMENHFRPDNSSYHVVIYNPETGNVIKKITAQGAADSSAWARGQSWGLYGYTMMYRETKDKKYLQQAQKIAKFILNNPHLPVDKVPYWDYDAQGIPNAKRDASSAAIMASALIELSNYSNTSLSKKYLNVASVILHSLSSPQYRAAYGENGGFILKHSVGNMNANADVDVPLPYADYYYLEALMRFKNRLQ